AAADCLLSGGPASGDDVEVVLDLFDFGRFERGLGWRCGWCLPRDDERQHSDSNQRPKYKCSLHAVPSGPFAAKTIKSSKIRLRAVSKLVLVVVSVAVIAPA